MTYAPREIRTPTAVTAIAVAALAAGCGGGDTREAAIPWLLASPNGEQRVELYFAGSSNFTPDRAEESRDGDRTIVTLYGSLPEAFNADLGPHCVRVRLSAPLRDRMLVSGARPIHRYPSIQRDKRRMARWLRREVAEGKARCRAIPNS
jgi:hypothetical protein